MAQLFDARNNEFQGSVDTIGGQVLTDARVAGATLAALNAELLMDIQGKAVALFEIRGATSVATYVFEATLDGVNYFSLPARSVVGTIVAVVQADSIVSSVVSTAAIAATYAVGVSGWRRVRCRVSAFTSGSAVVTGRASDSDYAIIAQPQPSLLNVSVAPAAGATATITIPAAAGLFHYLTALQVTAALNPATATVGAAPAFITTTNLPGTPAWVCPLPGNGAASVGGFAAHATLVNITWDQPLRSSVVNTNTTIVIPAHGAGTTIRANAQYYVGA